MLTATPDAAAEEKIPQPLQPWVEWVRGRHDDLNCARISAAELVCDWSSSLQLDVREDGGTFDYLVAIDKKLNIMLPGGRVGNSDSIWPRNVSVTRTDGSQGSVIAPVVELSRRPAVELAAGRYRIRGEFVWPSAPREIPVPTGAALVRITKKGVPTDIQPFADGMVYLRAEEQQQEAENVSYRVYRKLSDGQPLELETSISVEVSGKAREVVIPRFLPTESVPVQLISTLPARLGEGGALKVQLRPGQHTIQVFSVFQGNPGTISGLKVETPGWPSEEVWVWQPDEVRRTVDIGGVDPVDAATVGVSNQWSAFAAYLVKPESTLQLETKRRGAGPLPPNQLNLNRTLTLDLEGKGFTAVDSLSGTLSRGLRLNMSPAMELGTVTIANRTQLLTQDPDTQARGVEIRSENVSLMSVSHVKNVPSDIPAVGWQTDVESLSVSVEFPPGYMFLWATGPDTVWGSWVGSWTLYDLFLVLFTALAFAKLFERSIGLLALITMVICHNVYDAPFGTWFVLLGLFALLQVVPDGGFRTALNWFYRASLLGLLFIVFPFIVDQIRFGLYPQLALDGLTAYRRQNASIQPAGMSKDDAYPSRARDAEENLSVMSPPMMEGGVSPAPQSDAVTMAERYAASSEMADEAGYDMLQDKGGRRNAPRQTASIQEIDPTAIVQLGPGVPSWDWVTAQLNWNSRVPADETFSLTYIGPWATFFLALLRVLFVVALASLFFRDNKARGGNLIRGAVSVIALVLFNSPSAFAQEFPSETMLKELEQRILKDRCTENCIFSPEMKVEIVGEQIRITAKVSSNGVQGWTIPGPVTEFVPDRVMLDGTENAVLRRDGRGVLSARVPNGDHLFEIIGRAPKRANFTLQLASSPGHVSVTTDGWTADGVLPNGGTVGSIQFTRIARGERAEGEKELAEEESVLADYFHVTRTFNFGVDWTGQIQIVRFGDFSRPSVLQLPLVEGESLVRGNAELKDGKLQIPFARGIGRVEVVTRFERQESVSLTASSGDLFAERWVFRCSSLLQCVADPEKLPVTLYKENDTKLLQFDPFPNESTVVEILKPQAADGQTFLIESAINNYRPGKRETDVSSIFSVRNSKTESFRFALPEGATLSRVFINGAERSLEMKNGSSEFTLSPAPDQAHNITMDWRYPETLGVVSSLPGLKFSASGVNASINVTVPQDRWLLAVGGPSWGPAVLFWGKLFVVLLLAAAIAQSGVTPLGFASLMFLGFGIASVTAWEIAVVLGWFVALSLRTRVSLPPLAFNLFQVFLGLLSFAAISALFSAVRAGLILKPEMQVGGNNSTDGILRWYVDRFVDSFPGVTVYSLPIEVWRGFMLIWSVWLALSLLGWVRWGWANFSHDGLWKRPVRAEKAAD